MQLSYRGKPFRPMRRTPAVHSTPHPVPSPAVPTYRAKNSVKHWRNTQAPGFQRLQRPKHISLPSIGWNPSAKHSTVHGRVHDSCVSARLVRLVRSSFLNPQSHRQRIPAASLEQPFVSSHAAQVFPAFPESMAASPVALTTGRIRALGRQSSTHCMHGERANGPPLNTTTSTHSQAASTTTKRRSTNHPVLSPHLFYRKPGCVHVDIC